MKQSAIFVLTLLAAAAGAQASCYTVLGAKGQVLSESPNPPVDMSYQLHQTVPYKYGQGAVMIFGIADSNCGDRTDPFYLVSENLQSVERDLRGGSRSRGARPARRDRE